MRVGKRAVVSAACAAAVGLLAASTASGARGTLPEVVAVRALPIGQVLRHAALNTVIVKPGLAFKVTIRNTSSAARNVTLRLTIPRTPRTVGPVVKVKTLRVTPNQWKAATFSNLGAMQFAVRTTLRVNVETKVGNVRQTGSVVYPVIFALG